MKRLKKGAVLLLALAMAFTLGTGGAFGEETAVTAAGSPDISIIYTGDIHGRIDDNLSLAGMVAYGNSLKKQGNLVEYVDLGDALTGTVLASVSEGQYVVDAMNIADFGIAVPGAHDFDYGYSRLVKTLRARAYYTYTACNVTDAVTGNPVFESYVIRRYGGTRVAFIGICDPDTPQKSTADLSDGQGGYAADFAGDETGAELYAKVQAAIDESKMYGADYIVVLGHVTETAGSPFSPESIIGNTTGINAFINGNSHVATSYGTVRDLAGAQVVITNPGAELENIGVLTISPDRNTISTQLISSYNYRDTYTRDGIEALEETYSGIMGDKVATASYKLEAINGSGTRTVESKETNLGDLVADAIRTATGAQMALVDAAQLSANIPLGDVTYRTVATAVPSGEGVSVVSISGLDLMDVLEMSARLYPERNPHFLQISGLTYDINTTFNSSVTVDGNGNFTGVGSDYRVTNVKIQGRDLDLMDTYTLAASNKLLDGETGYSMLTELPRTKQSTVTDTQAVMDYMSQTLGGVIGSQYAQAQGRLDVIKIARQSEIDALVNEMVAEKSGEYAQEAEELRAVVELQSKVIAIKDLTLKARSQFTKTSAGKRKMKISWTASAELPDVEYQVYKSSKKSSGYKKAITTKKMTYTNTSGLTKGKRYYYKVRACIYAGGKYYYSGWSNVTYKLVSK